ncbi:MAG: hypothetical protein II295_02840 [Akkermansia sp.]|nr:hypothetical protein [Akkermansia sp.]
MRSIKAAIYYVILAPVFFLLVAWSGTRLLEHRADSRAWASQAAAWLGEAPAGWCHHDTRTIENKPEYFTYPANEQLVQEHIRHLKLRATELPSHRHAPINQAIACEDGAELVQAAYSREEPLIIQSHFAQYTVSCIPWLIQLKNGYCIYLTDNCGMLDTLTPSPSVYPDHAYHGTNDWSAAFEAGLFLLMLLLPTLLCCMPRLWLLRKQNPIISWQTACICILMPLAISLLWFIIVPEPDEDGIYTAHAALLLNGIFATSLYAMACVGCKLQAKPKG